MKSKKKNHKKILYETVSWDTYFHEDGSQTLKSVFSYTNDSGANIDG